MDQLGEAAALKAAGDALRLQYRLEEALQRYDEALALYRRLGDQLGAANVLLMIGSVLSFQHLLDEAMERYYEALQLYRQMERPLGQANVLYSMAEISRYRAEDDQALAQYAEAVGLYRRAGDQRGFARTLHGMGDVHCRQTELTEAADYYQQALALYRRLGDIRGEAGVQRDIGWVLQYQAEYDQALACYEASVELFRQLADPHGVATSLELIGELLCRSLQYDRAQLRYEESLALYQQVEDRHGEAKVVKALGDIWTFRTEFDRAQEQYDTAVALSRQVGDAIGVANTLESMGDLCLIRGDLDAALQRYEQALTLQRRVGNRPGEVTALQGIGVILHSRGEYRLALNPLIEALRLAQKIGNYLGIGDARKASGDVWQALSEPGKALAAYRQAVRYYGKAGSRAALAQALLAMGRLLQEQGRAEEAYRPLTRAGKLLEESRGLLQWEGSRRVLGAWGASLYQAIVQVCLSLGRAEEAWQWAERARGRVLLDLLGSREELARHPELFRLLDQQPELGQASVPRPRQLAAWLTRFARRTPASGSARPLLVEYFWLSPGRYALFALPLWADEAGQPPALTARVVDIGEGELNRLLNSLATALIAAEHGFAEATARVEAMAIFADLPCQMGRLFFEPWSDLLGALAPTDIVLVPHGGLHLLPLHAAAVDGQVPLLERFNLVYLPSATLARTLVQRSRRPLRKGARLVMGPPYRDDLPGAEAEVAKLAERWGPKALYQFAEMKVQVLREHAGRLRTLHLATHSRFEYGEYLRSYVQFHDEQLTLYDLMTDRTLDFHGLQLCYLSSCESGMVHRDAADNLQGLVWAIVQAGAGAVMSSLWRVDSLAARHVASRFYFHVRQGATMMNAYRQAVNHLRHEPAFANPYYWAPFLLTGDGFQRDMTEEAIQRDGRS